MPQQTGQLKTLTYKISCKDADIVPMPLDPWKVGKIVAQKNDVVTWKCKKHSIIVMFPKARTPLLNGVCEVSAKDTVTGIIDGSASGVYSYTILVQDPKGVFHSVEGNSPPEMVIE